MSKCSRIVSLLILFSLNLSVSYKQRNLSEIANEIHKQFPISVMILSLLFPHASEFPKSFPEGSANVWNIFVRAVQLSMEGKWWGQ